MANTVEVDIIARLEKLESKIDKQAKQKGKEAGGLFGSSFSTAVGTFVGVGLLRGLNRAIDGFKNQITGVVGAATKLEVIETQFKTILGSTQAAQKQLKDLQQFAATTPFQLPGLSDATRQLLSFGVAQEDIIPTLRQVGELAAGVGVGIDQLTIPFGRLISTQKLTLVELDKFADRGINLYGKLSEQTGISLKNIRDEISKGRVPFEEFTKALSDLTSKGGTFFKATEAQSKTLAGVISTLQDNFFNLQGTLGETFRPLLISIVSKTTVVIQNLVKSIEQFTSAPQNIRNLTQEFANFGQAVIRFGIAPLEALFNAGDFVFKFIVNAVNNAVAAVGILGQSFGEFLELIGAGGGVSQSLKNFGESSSAVLDDSRAALKESAEGLFDFGLSDKLSTNIDELQTFFDEVLIKQQENGEIIRQNNNDLANSLVSTNVEAATSITDLLSSVQLSFTTTQEQLKTTAKQISQVVKNALVKGISGGIQTIVNAVASGQNAFQAFGKFVLQTVGDLAIKLGETLIFAGIGVESLKSLGGAAAIAAGAGLVALGAIIKSIAGGSGGGSTASGGIGAQGDVVQTQDVALQADQDSIQERGPSNQIIVQGSIVDPQGILDAVSQISEENGAVLTGVSFA